MLFDTLELSKALQASFTPEQAETLAQAFSKASSDQLATKADIADLKGEFSELRGDVKAQIAGSETRLTNQISLLRADTIEWIVSAIGFNFLATAGLIITLTRVFGH